jgi:hypothetical protein
MGDTKLSSYSSTDQAEKAIIARTIPHGVCLPCASSANPLSKALSLNADLSIIEFLCGTLALAKSFLSLKGEAAADEGRGPVNELITT